MEKNISKKFQIILIVYSVISAMSFTYFVMPENSGAGILAFVISQFIFIQFIIPGKKTVFFFIPIFIMALNAFWSANEIWKFTNLLISSLILACISFKFDFNTDTTAFLNDIIRKVLLPFSYFKLPFLWLFKFGNEKTDIVKRIAIALALAVPCALFLTLILANADMVFYIKTENFITGIFDGINLHTVFIIICGIIMGLYLFGVIYQSLTQNNSPNEYKDANYDGDLIIINTLLVVLLIIYTLFVIIQFKYLFAGSVLPNNLTYTEYARKGFFELLALTVVNIIGILASVQFTKRKTGKWAVLNKILCHYLCTITVILLVSSFYRMWLYTNDDGLTRLRLFVMGFLVFEAIGLIATYLYIAKPKFNITLIYLCISFAYYLLLNIVPVDTIIAQNQINKYIRGEREGVDYIFTLSADAALPMENLYQNTDDEHIKNRIKTFLELNTNSEIPQRWQRYNISVECAKNILERIR